MGSVRKGRRAMGGFNARGVEGASRRGRARSPKEAWYHVESRNRRHPISSTFEPKGGNP